MFEQTLEEMHTSFYVTTEEARLASEYGVPLVAGAQDVTYPQAVAIVHQMEHLYISVPKYKRKRFKAILGSLRNAFGPEFWQRYPDRLAVEEKAFLPRTRWA